MGTRKRSPTFWPGQGIERERERGGQEVPSRTHFVAKRRGREKQWALSLSHITALCHEDRNRKGLNNNYSQPLFPRNIAITLLCCVGIMEATARTVEVENALSAGEMNDITFVCIFLRRKYMA